MASAPMKDDLEIEGVSAYGGRVYRVSSTGPWRISYTTKGQPRWRSTGTKDLLEAVLQLRAMEHYSKEI